MRGNTFPTMDTQWLHELTENVRREDVEEFLVHGKKEAGYFFFLFVCIYMVVLRVLKKSRQGLRRILWVLFLAIVPLGTGFMTWQNIVAFVRADVAEYTASHAGSTYLDWLDNSQIFVRAYQDVTFTNMRWWWSSQLLFFVLSMVVFVQVESRRSKIASAWAFLGLGFGGAISVALPLFFLVVPPTRIAIARKRPTPAVAGVFTMFCLILSSLFTTVLPLSLNADGSAGKPYKIFLLGLHGFLIIPSVLDAIQGHEITKAQRRANGDAESSKLYLLYGVLAGIALANHTLNTAHILKDINPSLDMAGLETVFEQVKSGAFVSFCQASISEDVLFTTVLAALYMLVDATSYTLSLMLVLLTPVLSIGFTFPVFLIRREMYLQEKAQG